VRGHRARIILAFFAIYVLWGSTFLAIRVAVETVPPLLAASIRFVVAGGLLLAWSWWRGARFPSRHEWRNLTVLGTLMFLLTYSALFWAQKTIPSGVASVLVATLPLWTAVIEMFVLKSEPPRVATLGAIVLGLVGVAVLVLDPRGGGVDVLACVVVTATQVSWAVGTALTTRMTLPASDAVSAGGQMLTGGVMLLAGSALLREVPPLPAIPLAAAAAIAYLVVAGSLLAFTAYVWLLKHVDPMKVTSYAYVNPVVALLIGHELGGEPLGLRTVLGGALVLACTASLLRRRRRIIAADAHVGDTR
jgi:drug/metabolite transporter (DMT)-like permease